MFVALLDVTVHALKPAYVSWGGPLQSIRTFILTIYTVHIILGICIKGKYIFETKKKKIIFEALK